MYTVYKSLINYKLTKEMLYSSPIRYILSEGIKSYISFPSVQLIIISLPGKLNDKFGLENLHHKYWVRTLNLFYIILWSAVLNHFFSLIPSKRVPPKRESTTIPFYSNTRYFKYNFVTTNTFVIQHPFTV